MIVWQQVWAKQEHVDAAPAKQGSAASPSELFHAPQLPSSPVLGWGGLGCAVLPPVLSAVASAALNR